jgi:hypothetical protein
MPTGPNAGNGHVNGLSLTDRAATLSKYSIYLV